MNLSYRLGRFFTQIPSRESCYCGSIEDAQAVFLPLFLALNLSSPMPKRCSAPLLAEPFPPPQRPAVAAKAVTTEGPPTINRLRIKSDISLPVLSLIGKSMEERRASTF